MDNKKIVKYFYEVIVSENMLDKLSEYISEDCVFRIGEKTTFVGVDGMRPVSYTHLDVYKRQHWYSGLSKYPHPACQSNSQTILP